MMYQGTDAVETLIDVQREVILDNAVKELRKDGPLPPEARINYLDNRGRLKVDFT